MFLKWHVENISVSLAATVTIKTEEKAQEAEYLLQWGQRCYQGGQARFDS